jgi:alkylation response protein AidB-like acyl-CoA dehydrogenase
MLHVSIDDTDDLLARASQLGRDELAPRAQLTDSGTAPPRENFAALARAGLLGLTVPRDAGGLDADALTVLQVTETLSRYCAVTAFLLVQHTGICASIAAGESPAAPTMLPALASGAMIAAIGASQLRRAGPPMLRATRVSNGYRLDGRVPWASGYGLMTHIALGAVEKDAGPLFFWLPFREAEGLSFGPPQDLMVMRASMTVNVTCEDLFVPQEHVIGDDARGYWQAQHGGALANPVAFLLGIGEACLDGMRTAVERSNIARQRQRLHELEASLGTARRDFYELARMMRIEHGNVALLDALLALRVATSRLVLTIAETAIAMEGGSAHLRSNVAQRHLREASFFLTVTVNPAAREAIILGI